MSEAKEYINSLQKFSDSILHLVEAIKAQTKAGDDTSLKDAVSSTKAQSELLLQNAKQLTVLTEDSKETKSNTQEILKIVKDLKQEKKKGIWETLSNKDKAKDIKSSVKTITLMAGGILAIGAAFKIVGEVDFKSVMALSLALPAVSYAFNKVGENSSSTKENTNTALSMIIMSGGILGSSLLLSMAPTISLNTLFTTIGVSVSLAIAMYGVSKAIENTSNDDIKRMYMVAPVMPVLAGGIVASGLLLQQMPTIGIKQVLSTIGVGIAMGSSLIPLAIASRMVGGKSKEMTTLSLLLPLTSAGLVASGLLLQNMPSLDTVNILKSTVTIGASSVALAGTVWAMNKMGLASPGGLKTVTFGMLGATLMSGGLMAMSHILNLGNYSNYPTTEWATGVGLSMLGYLPAVIVTGTIAMTGIGALALLAGVASMTGIAGGLAEVSHILNKGNYTGGPTEKWAIGTGLALMGFVDPILKLNPGLFGMLFGDTLSTKIEAIEKIGTGLKNASINIAGGNYTGGPTEEWSKGVGLALMSFAATMESVKPGFFESLIFGTSLDDKLNSMKKVAKFLPELGEAVGTDTSVYSGGPDPDWAGGAAKAILAFAETLNKVDTGWVKSNLDERLRGMKKVAKFLPELGEAVGDKTSMYKGGPKKEWAEAIALTLGAFTGSLNDIDDAWFGSNLGPRLESIKKVARTIKEIGWAVGNDNSMYKGAPPKKWTDNVSHAISSFTSIKGIQNTKDSTSQIYKLAWSYKYLAKTLSGLGDTLKELPDKTPDISGVYAGLVTLSLIDDSKLKDVLGAIDEHKGNLTDTMSAIIKASEEQKSKFNTDGFTGIMDFAKLTSQKAASAPMQNVNPLMSSGIQSSVTQQKQKEPEPVKIDTTSLEEKVSNLSSLLTSVKEVLDEIADNTEGEKDINKILN